MFLLSVRLKIIYVKFKFIWKPFRRFAQLATVYVVLSHISQS